MPPTSHTEAETCDRFITPAILRAGWDSHTQVRREFTFTDGQVLVRGKVAVRGKQKRADYLLFFGPNLPLAVVEAKEHSAAVGAGMRQALAYAEALDVPFVFSSNGTGFMFHDRTGLSNPVERFLSLDDFPSPSELWSRYRAWKGLSNEPVSIRLVSSRPLRRARDRVHGRPAARAQAGLRFLHSRDILRARVNSSLSVAPRNPTT